MGVKTVLFTAQSQEWLDFRKNYVTGTEIAALFGLNEYKSANNLALEKFGGKESDFVDNSFAEIGKTFEDAIINRVGGLTAGELGKVLLYYDDDLGISCTLDGELNGAPLECKCMYHNKFTRLEQRMPPSYIMQLLLQMHMVGSNIGYFGVLTYVPEDFERTKKEGQFNPNFDMFPLIIEGISLYKLEVSNLEKYISYLRTAMSSFKKDKVNYKVNRLLSSKMKKFLDEEVKYEFVRSY